MIRNERFEQIKGLLRSDERPEDIAKKIYAFGITDNPDRPNLPLNDGEIEQVASLCDTQHYEEKAAIIDAIQQLIQNANVPIVGASDLPPVRILEQTGYKLKTSSTSSTHACIRRMSEVREKPVEWITSQYIPTDTITLIAGNGGVGKTAIWCNLVAAVTSGRDSIFDQAVANPFTVGRSQQVGNALVLSSEDDSSTLHARLRVAGANMERVHYVPIDDEHFGDILFGSTTLEKLIDDIRPRVVVFDPIQSFLPPHVNMAKRNQIRACLNPLIGWGKKYHTTFIIILHTRKGTSVSGRDRIADSADIFDIARAVYIVGKADKSGLVYLSQEKNSYAAAQPTILLRMEDVDGTGRVVYCGTSELRDADYVQKAAQERPAPKLATAREFIIKQLSDGNEHYAEEMRNLAMANGISAKTYTNARASLKSDGMITYHPASFRGKSVIRKI